MTIHRPKALFLGHFPTPWCVCVCFWEGVLCFTLHSPVLLPSSLAIYLWGWDCIHFYIYNCIIGLEGKKLPTVQKTHVSSLGWEDSPKKGMATHSSILAWRILWTGSLVGYSPNSQTQLSNFYFMTIYYI